MEDEGVSDNNLVHNDRATNRYLVKISGEEDLLVIPMIFFMKYLFTNEKAMFVPAAF